MNLHSVVDVITNSSSVTFVFSDNDSVVKTKEFISEIFKAVGINADVDDYFDISLDYSDSDYYDADDEGDIGRNALYAKLKIVPKNDTAKNLYSLAASSVVVWDSYSEDCVKNGKKQDNSILGDLRDYAC